MTDISALSAEFKQAMQTLYGDRLAQVILYGSYARGDFHDESDVDFMVVLKDEDIKRHIEIEQAGDVLSDLLTKYGRLISFVPTTEQFYQTNDFLFYRNVRREGKAI